MMPRKEIELVPLSQFSARIAQGWSMITGYPLEPGDFAVTMSPPGWRDTRSNLGRAAIFRVEKTRLKSAERLKKKLEQA